MLRIFFILIFRLFNLSLLKSILFTDKVKLDVDVAYEVIKNDNGDIRFKLKPEDNTYTFEFLEKVTFAADNVFIGSQDISEYSFIVIYKT